MKLYHLVDRTNIWRLDSNDEFLIRAKSPKAARKIAAEHACDEGPDTWLDPVKSSCRVVKEDGEEGVIIVSYNAA